MKNSQGKKISIVTGASSGIGKAVSIYLAKQNYLVVLIARNEERLKDVQAEILRQNGSSIFCSVDVSEPAQVKSDIAAVIAKLGTMDLLFNNAGILPVGTTTTSDSDIDNAIKINLNGAIYVAKYVAEQMKQQR